MWRVLPQLSAPSPDPASLKAGTEAATASPGPCSPSGHLDTVLDGVVAELERHPAAATMPIQVVKDLPDLFVVSRAMGPPALDERRALISLR